MYVHIHFLESADPTAAANLAPRCYFLISLSSKRNQSIEEVTDSRIWQEIYNMSSYSDKVFKEMLGGKKSKHNARGMSNRYRKSSQWPKLGQFG